MDTLFISDLHLSPDRPEKLELFKRLLQGRAREAAALYILGDIFEQFWVGNDDQTPPSPEIIHELQAFSRSGSRLYILRGNRDLLIDQGFEKITGCTLLPDISTIDLSGTKVLLMHGDLLCTRDWKYQMFRRVIENPVTRHVFARMPYRLRITLSHGLRPLLQRSTLNKPAQIIDVDQHAVEQTMRTCHVTELIHGHTHRPGFHTFDVDGVKATRIVLGDWYEDDLILVCRNSERALVRVADYIDRNNNKVSFE